jgi:hypothetical protein
MMLQLIIFKVGEKSKAFTCVIASSNVSVMVMTASLYLHRIT